MIFGMAKAAMWIGAGLILLGTVVGFVKQGECGSVFDPRDKASDRMNELYADAFNDPSMAPADCSAALDLTGPVWLLIGAGVVVGFVGFCVWLNQRAQVTADSHDDNPSGNPAL